MMTPTTEQENIINEEASSVVIARPGSGKTFTLSYKIRNILSSLPEHRGIIAISYTNKASDEFRDRVLNLGVQKRSSFFGTIDKFCLTEIVIPFLRHKFGLPPTELKIIKSAESEFLKQLPPEEADGLTWELVEKLYHAGEIILDFNGRIASQLLKENRILKEYLKAKYSHIIIDEYQDSGKEQHDIFLELFNLGLTAIAVGDLDQSIYAFAGKSSDFLYELSQRPDFKKYPLTVNRRCHPSIATYSLKLINPNFVFTNTEDEKRVYCKTVQGYQPEIAKWIEDSIPGLQKKFTNVKPGHVGILCRSNDSAKLIKNNITKYEVQFREATPLDSMDSPWSFFFSECLYCLLDPKQSVNDLFEKYMDSGSQKTIHKNALSKLIELKGKITESDFSILKNSVDALRSAAEILVPQSEKLDSERALQETLVTDIFIESYLPQKDTHIQIMTLHKSKGLEFDIVFHLDLYQWIIPSFQAIKGDEKEKIQSVNLHYVGITRAKQACILVTSTQRYDPKTKNSKDAQLSEFLIRQDLASMRKNLK